MVSNELIKLLRCPNCVRDNDGFLELRCSGYWLVCQEPGCGRKYPIRAGIPVMLVEEADKWSDYGIGELPIPPPGS